MSEPHAITTTEVSWQADDIPVEGTYTQPAGKGPFPAIIMVAGSGPTDRNWNTPLLPGTNGSAALLAQELFTAGFATLRYDKRASGPNAMENIQRLSGRISMNSHLDELKGAVDLLASQDAVDSGRIFGLGNSEGCIHILNYQTSPQNPRFKGIVLTAPPANPVRAVAHNQIAALLQAVPDGEKWLSLYDLAIKDFLSGKQVDMDENAPATMRSLVLALTNPINQPFSRELWEFDPIEVLKKISVPVLIVIGKKDIQVDWLIEGKVFDSVAESYKNITIAYPENANHVLKYEPTPRKELNPVEAAARYNADDAKLDPQAIQIIKEWLTEHL